MPAKEVAQEVGALYAEYPYPDHGVISSVIATLLRDPLDELIKKRSPHPLRYLDAGCGTGEQTLGVGRQFPALDVLGVDFNQASLRRAQELSREQRIPARFERRDLMKSLTDLGTFDVITSIGVLHSLPEPAMGFKSLRAVASEHTLFLGMVYGRFGKWELFNVRDALAMITGPDASRAERLSLLREGGLAINTGLIHYGKTLRDRMRFGPRISLWEAARRVLAGRNDAYQADGYTHVQEETYTWDELIALLEATGWEFIGWPRKSGIPDAPNQLLKGRAAKILGSRQLREQAAVYERLVRPANLFFIARPK